MSEVLVDGAGEEIGPKAKVVGGILEGMVEVEMNHLMYMCAMWVGYIVRAVADGILQPKLRLPRLRYSQNTQSRYRLLTQLAAARKTVPTRITRGDRRTKRCTPDCSTELRTQTLTRKVLQTRLTSKNPEPTTD